jgi:acetolactate synthase small subunit
MVSLMWFITVSQSISQTVSQTDFREQVLYVEDLTAKDRVERELVLIKVRASTIEARIEITQLARIYGGSILDASGTNLQHTRCMCLHRLPFERRMINV